MLLNAVLWYVGRRRLAFGHSCELAVEIVQAVVPALFYDTSIFQDEDRIAVADG